MPGRAGEPIETARLLLRPMVAEDTHALLAIFADPLVMASFGVACFDDQQMAAWVQRNLDHQAQFGYGLFAVILKENGVLIGDCGLECLTVADQVEVELGYDVRSDYWRQGLATEAAAAVRDYALHTLHLPRLISLIREGNDASRRVAEKIGMHLEATFARQGRQYWRYALSHDDVPTRAMLRL